MTLTSGGLARNAASAWSLGARSKASWWAGAVMVENSRLTIRAGSDLLARHLAGVVIERDRAQLFEINSALFELFPLFYVLADSLSGFFDVLDIVTPLDLAVLTAWVVHLALNLFFPAFFDDGSGLLNGLIDFVL